MAQNLVINGVTYNSVNSVSIPKSDGGYAVFPDTSDANATESDILSGKTAYVNGVKITGTGTGSGVTPNYIFIVQSGSGARVKLNGVVINPSSVDAYKVNVNVGDTVLFENTSGGSWELSAIRCSDSNYTVFPGSSFYSMTIVPGMLGHLFAAVHMYIG